MFYNYFHRKADTGEIFYVGKGQGTRAYVKERNNIFWNRIVKKHGYTVEIVCYFDNEELSFSTEKYLIEKIGRRDLGLGPLVNLTDGGDGLRNISEEIRKKISEGQKGNKNHMFGKKWSKETRKKMQISRKSPWNKGLKMSSEHCKKLSDTSARKGNPGTMLGKKHSAKAIEKIKRNRKLNPPKITKEYREKLSKSVTESWKKRKGQS
jgi:hypothetical protein